MKAILYICHGSRLRAAKEEAIQFITTCIAYRSGYSSLFLELANPSIEEGFRTCAKRGATELLLIPVFYCLAGHVKNDIPFELEKLNNQYPNISDVW